LTENLVTTDSLGFFTIKLTKELPDTLFCTYSSIFKRIIVENKEDTIKKIDFIDGIRGVEIQRSFLYLYTESEIKYTPFNLGIGLNFFTGENSSLYCSFDYSTDFKSNELFNFYISQCFYKKTNVSINYLFQRIIYNSSDIDISRNKIYFGHSLSKIDLRYIIQYSYNIDNKNINCFSGYLINLDKQLFRIRNLYFYAFGGIEYGKTFSYNLGIELSHYMQKKSVSVGVKYDTFMNLNTLKFSLRYNFFKAPKYWPFTFNH